MKKLIFILCGVLLLFTSCISIPRIPDGYEQIESRPTMYERFDEFQNVTWIFNEQMFSNKNSTVYIGKTKDKIWMRIKFIYSGSDWIFFENATFVNQQGKRLSFKFNSWDKKTEVKDGYVKESIDILISDSEIQNLLELYEGTNVRLRLSGEKYKEYEINDMDFVQGIKETINFYFSQKNK